MRGPLMSPKPSAFASGVTTLPASASFYALHALRHTPGNGERIDKALHAIEEANLSKLRDVFQDISFNSNKLGDEQQKNDILRHLLEDLADHALLLVLARLQVICICMCIHIN